MNKLEFSKLEGFMLSKMIDSAHDRFHIYRVLYSALDIAKTEVNVNLDILIAACLLHDIGRDKQSSDPSLCHAQVGGEMAFDYLMTEGWSAEKVRHIQACINSHRYRSDNPPQSIEAKILFDADKLDVSGALGIARTLIYSGQVAEPLYIFDDADIVLDGGGGDISSFLQEYNYKLKKVYASFFTERARQIAMERERISIDYYNCLLNEITQIHTLGVQALNDIVDAATL